MKRRDFMQAMATTAISFAVLGSGVVRAQSSCSSIYVRRDCLALSGREWSSFVAAVKQVNKPLLGFLRPTVYDGFAQKYSSLLQHSPVCGFDSPIGLFYLRQFLVGFERALQQSDTSVSLPYWNFSLDSQAPERSSVLSPSLMGGNGRQGDRVVIDGSFAGWRVGYPGVLGAVPESHTLTRDFAGGDSIPAFSSPEAVAAILQQSQTIDALTDALLGNVVAQVFSGIGGDIGTSFSPNDPLFWLVACYIDKLFGDWLQMHPEVPQPETVCYQYA